MADEEKRETDDEEKDMPVALRLASAIALGFVTACLILLAIYGVVYIFKGCGYDTDSLYGTTASVSEPLAKDTYKEDRLEQINDRIWTVTDDKTGVQYLIYNERGMGGGICPRYNADGTLCIDTEWKGE